jgi:hypothetical protein
VQRVEKDGQSGLQGDNGFRLLASDCVHFVWGRRMTALQLEMQLMAAKLRRAVAGRKGLSTTELAELAKTIDTWANAPQSESNDK